jgi:hypothetical protein
LREQARISWSWVRRVWGLLQCCHIVFARKSLTRTNWCAGALWFQLREQVRISWSQVRRVWGMLQCCHIVFVKKSLTITNWCAGVLLLKRNQMLVLYWNFGVFLSDHIPEDRQGCAVPVPDLHVTTQWIQM